MKEGRKSLQIPGLDQLTVQSIPIWKGFQPTIVRMVPRHQLNISVSLLLWGKHSDAKLDSRRGLKARGRNSKPFQTWLSMYTWLQTMTLPSSDPRPRIQLSVDLNNWCCLPVTYQSNHYQRPYWERHWCHPGNELTTSAYERHTQHQHLAKKKLASKVKNDGNFPSSHATAHR